MTDMRALILSIAPLLITLMTMLLGHGLLGTGTAIRLDVDGYTTVSIGIVSAGYAVGFMLGTLIVPGMIGRVGHIRVFAAFASLFTVGALVQGMAVDPILWTFLRFLAGFCIAGIFTMTESWINGSTANAIRGRVLSVYMTCNYFAYTMAQMLIGVVDPATAPFFMVCAILVCLSVLPLSLATSQPPVPVQALRFSVQRLFRLSPLGFTAVITSGLLNSLLANFAPVLAREIEPENVWVAQLMTALVVSGFLLQMPLGRLSDRFDRRKVLICCGIGTLLCGLFGLLSGTDSKAEALVLIAIAGALVPAFYSIGIAHATDFVDSNDMVSASAGLLMCYGIGTVIGPLVGGVMLDSIGTVHGMFSLFSLFSLVLVVFGLYRMTVRDVVPDEEKGEFQILRPTTTVAFALDPRGEDEQMNFDLGEEGQAILTASGAGLESAGESAPITEPAQTAEEQQNPYAA
jgi:MFS family permease